LSTILSGEPARTLARFRFGTASTFAMSIESLDMAQAAGAPIETLESWFSAHNWLHERIGDEEIVASAKGAWNQYELRGLWREDDCVLQFLAFPDIKVTDAQASVIYEAIGLINEQLWLGHFEYWPTTGIIVYRHAALLDAGSGEAVFSFDQAEVLVEAAIDELDRFYPVFQFVLWGGKSPREAIASAMVETQGEA
jgi:hypothetical protein